jgi:protein-disulfide isomerase
MTFAALALSLAQVAGAPPSDQPAQPIQRVRLDLADALARGPADAPVTLVEVIDYQCPYCARAYATVEALLEKYPGRLRLVLLQNPLPMHPDAPLAARAVLAADAQGKLVEMHGLVLQNQGALKRQDLMGYAQRLGLDAKAFEAALDDARLDTRVQAQVARATDIGAQATPFFFVNGRPVRGALPIEAFTALIDEELAGPKRPTEWVATLPQPTPGEGDPLLRQLTEIRNELRDLRKELAELRQTLGAKKPAAAAPAAAAKAQPAASPAPDAVGTVRLDPQRSLGSKRAALGFVEFSEFQCPFCRRFYVETFPQIKAQYIDSGKMRYSFRDFPLEFHGQAKDAAVAARCAGHASAYWDMRAGLMANQSRLGAPLYEELAGNYKLDLAAFKTCLADASVSKAVSDDAKYGESLKVSGTPHFFIGRLQGDQLVAPRTLVGAHPFEAFKAIIEELLRAAAN